MLEQIMKKVICLIAVVALTAPTFAQDVTVTCEDQGEGVVAVRFDAQGLGQRVRGFALDIEADSGAAIDATYGGGDGVADFKTGISVSGDKGYGIFPGTVTFSGDPLDFDQYGIPVAPQSDYPADTLPGPGSAGMTVELGSLYDPDQAGTDAPDPCGVLFTFKVDADCNVCITVNVVRGGIVMEDGSAGAIAGGQSCCAIVVSAAQPTCWDSCPGQPFGDATCDGSVDFADLGALKGSWGMQYGDPPNPPKEYNCCANFDHAGAVDFADLGLLKGNWGGSFAAPPTPILDCPVE
jgi:hypothetical protein